MIKIYNRFSKKNSFLKKSVVINKQSAWKSKWLKYATGFLKKSVVKNKQSILVKDITYEVINSRISKGHWNNDAGEM